MKMLKIEVPHRLSKEDALERARQLLGYWGKKYGIHSDWTGDTARLNGKVLGIALQAILTISEGSVHGEASDPGLLLRNRARKYIEEKFAMALDPKRKPEDMMRDA
jgi:hypothetical protein